MKKALPLLFLLLSLSAFAQITTFTTKPTLSSTLFLIDYEDGKPDPANFVGAVDLSGCPYSKVDLPFDPLILEGLVPGYGSTASDLIGGPGCPSSIIARGGSNGTSWFTEQWQLEYLTNPYNNDYPYTWNGTFTVTFKCQQVGRYGRGCGYYKAGEGSGKLTAVRN